MAKSKTDPRTPDSSPLSELQDYCVFQPVLLFCTCIYCLPSPCAVKRALDTTRKHQLLSLITPRFGLISPNPPLKPGWRSRTPSATVPNNSLPVSSPTNTSPQTSQPLGHDLLCNLFAKPANLAAELLT